MRLIFSKYSGSEVANNPRVKQFLVMSAGIFLAVATGGTARGGIILACDAGNDPGQSGASVIMPGVNQTPPAGRWTPAQNPNVFRNGVRLPPQTEMMFMNPYAGRLPPPAETAGFIAGTFNVRNAGNPAELFMSIGEGSVRSGVHRYNWELYGRPTPEASTAGFGIRYGPEGLTLDPRNSWVAGQFNNQHSPIGDAWLVNPDAMRLAMQAAVDKYGFELVPREKPVWFDAWFAENFAGDPQLEAAALEALRLSMDPPRPNPYRVLTCGRMAPTMAGGALFGAAMEAGGDIERATGLPSGTVPVGTLGGVIIYGGATAGTVGVMNVVVPVGGAVVGTKLTSLATENPLTQELGGAVGFVGGSAAMGAKIGGPPGAVVGTIAGEIGYVGYELGSLGYNTGKGIYNAGVWGYWQTLRETPMPWYW